MISLKSFESKPPNDSIPNNIIIPNSLICTISNNYLEISTK